MRRLLLLVLCACGSPPRPAAPAHSAEDWHALARRAREQAAAGHDAEAREIGARAVAGALRDGITPKPRVVAAVPQDLDRIVVDPTGTRVATISPRRQKPNDNATTVVWSVLRGRDAYELPSTPAIAFDRSGHALTGGFDGKIALRDAASGRVLRELGKLEHPAVWVAFAPDGSMLAADEMKFHEWDASGQERHTWAAASDFWSLPRYELSPDGTTLVALVGNYRTGNEYVTWSLHDPQRNATRTPIAGNYTPTGALAISADGSRAAIGFATPSVEIVDLVHHKQLQSLQTRADAVAFRDGDTLVAAGEKLEQWTLHDGSRGSSAALPVKPAKLAFTAAASRAIAATTAELAVITVDDARVAARFGHDGGPTVLGWSPDGSQLAVGDIAGRVAVWPVTAGGAPVMREVPGAVAAVALDQDGRLAAGTSSIGSPRILVWGRDGKQLRSHETGAFSALAFDGETLILGDRYATEVEAYDRNGQAIDPPPKLEIDVTSRVYLGKLRADADGARVVVHREPDEYVVSVLRQDTEITALAGRGSMLAVARTDGAIALWEPATGTSLGLLVGPREDVAVSELAFRPDGRVLAAARSDGLVELWDMPSRTRVAELLVADGGQWFVIARDGSVEGTPGPDAPLTWELGDVTLPARLAWSPSSGLLPRTLAAAPAAVAVAPVVPPARPAAHCLPDEDLELARLALTGTKLSTCFIRRPDDAWCFDLDLATGAVTPLAPDLEIQGAKLIDTDTGHRASTLAPVVSPSGPAVSDAHLAAKLVDGGGHLPLVEIDDAKTGKRLRRFHLADADERATSVEIWDGALLASTFPCAGPCGSSSIYDVATGRRLGPVGSDENPADTYDFSPIHLHDHIHAFREGGSGGPIVLQNIATGRVIARLTSADLDFNEEYSWLSTELLRTPSGGVLVTGNNKASGRVWELDGKGKLVRKWRLPVCEDK